MKPIQSVIVSGSPRQVEKLKAFIEGLFNSPVNIEDGERRVICRDADLELYVRQEINAYHNSQAAA